MRAARSRRRCRRDQLNQLEIALGGQAGQGLGLVDGQVGHDGAAEARRSGLVQEFLRAATINQAVGHHADQWHRHAFSLRDTVEDVIELEVRSRARVYDAWMTGPSAMGSL